MQSLITFYAQQTVVLVVVAARARVEVLIMEVRLGSFEAPRSNSFRFILRQSNFVSRSERLAALAVRHPVPTVFENREFIAAGGLMGRGGRLAIRGNPQN